MTYAEAKRRADATEGRLIQLGHNCTSGSIDAWRQARLEFERAAAVAHDLWWAESDAQQRRRVVCGG